MEPTCEQMTTGGRCRKCGASRVVTKRWSDGLITIYCPDCKWFVDVRPGLRPHGRHVGGITPDYEGDE